MGWKEGLSDLLSKPPYSGMGGKRLLAKRLGVDPHSISNWVHGKCSPSAEHQQAIVNLAKEAQ